LFGDTLMLDFSLKVEKYNALADVQLLTFDKYAGTLNCLPVCVPAEINTACIIFCH
jgi:hypothetical protein